MDTPIGAMEMKSYADEAFRTLQQEKESRAKDREAYDDRVARLRKKVDESLQQTLRRCMEPSIRRLTR